MYRNAARARVKDATGKAQRAHFGKKRFEVLQTGLSKSRAVKSNSAKEMASRLPEISLAHAKRHLEGPAAEFAMGTEWQSPRMSPTMSGKRCRSPSAASHRSRILHTLDAESRAYFTHTSAQRACTEYLVIVAAAQRTQVEKILQIPDLLGLSATRKHRERMSSSPLPRTPKHRRTRSDCVGL